MAAGLVRVYATSKLAGTQSSDKQLAYFIAVKNLSVELPEAYILAKQMNTALTEKQVAACNLQNSAKYQHLGFMNRYLSDFERLCNCNIESVVFRGNTIHLKFDKELNLLLAPEYGGIILFHPKGNVIPLKFHLRLSFTYESALTVRLTGMGVIKAISNAEISHSYVYRRDFSARASPVEENFTYKQFSESLTGRGVNLKAVLVGKDAVVVGLGNAAFQDILYRAGIHPKRKASELNAAEQHALFGAIQFVVAQRIKLGGKTQFVDLYGKNGSYVSTMGPSMKGKICTKCYTEVERISLGGGQTYLCPSCQK